MMPSRLYRSFAGFLLILSFLFGGCGGEPELVRRTQFIMGTLVDITVRGGNSDTHRAAIQAAFDEMKRLETLMSTHRPDSEISRLNQNAGGEFLPVSPEVLEVIQSGVSWAERSGGAVDITMGPVVELWGFDEEKKAVPSDRALTRATDRVDSRAIQIRDGKVRLARKGMKLHLGAIAKGYAVDRAAAVLQQRNIAHALVNAGGDLVALGQRDAESSWRIGLQHPRNPQAILASFALSGQAVATSGDYQKYFTRQGIRYHHILDPETGRPARKVISATVLADSAMDADAAATALFVMGPQRGIPWIDRLDGVEGMTVGEKGSLRFSRNFRSLPGFRLQDFAKNADS